MPVGARIEQVAADAQADVKAAGLTFVKTVTYSPTAIDLTTPLTQAKQLLEIAETVPKGLKWKTRARVGDRVRWYELPEEVDH